MIEGCINFRRKKTSSQIKVIRIEQFEGKQGEDNLNAE